MNKLATFSIVALLFYSCNYQTVVPATLISNFYESKYAFMDNYRFVSYEERLSELKKLQASWNEMVKNKATIIPYLLSFDGDSLSTSLYGNKEEKLHYYQVCKLENDLHALSLIDAIARNDYLFNRRYFAGANWIFCLKNDSFCFLKMREAGFMNLPHDSCAQKNLRRKYVNLGWDYCLEWYEKFSGEAGISAGIFTETPLKWFGEPTSFPAINLKDRIDPLKSNYPDFHIDNGL